LYDLLRPHVTKIVVCNPRRNALLKEGNKSDRIDAQKLAELLYLNKLAMLETTTGEVVKRTLLHEGNHVREFYSTLPRPVLHSFPPHP
jgi:hypothetical protein